MTPDTDAIARLLRNGGVAVLPTDTIYGFHCLADDEAAISRMASLKERDDTKPFIVLGNSIEQLQTLGASFTVETRAVLAELWPGPLTAIVPMTRQIAASRGTASIGVRVPAVKWLRDLMALTGPLASTSVNRTGQPPILSPTEMPRGLRESVGAVVDTGPLPGKASAIVDFTGHEPLFIREGENLFTQTVWKTLRKSL